MKCFRIKRTSGLFTVYYKSTDDCDGGSWTELLPSVPTSNQLNDNGAVSIGWNVQYDATWVVSFFRCIGTCSSVTTGTSSVIGGQGVSLR